MMPEPARDSLIDLLASLRTHEADAERARQTIAKCRRAVVRGRRARSRRFPASLWGLLVAWVALAYLVALALQVVRTPLNLIAFGLG